MCNNKISQGSQSLKTTKLQTLTNNHRQDATINHRQPLPLHTVSASNPLPTKLDMFQIYSTEGVIAREFESFGLTSHHQPTANGGASNGRGGARTIATRRNGRRTCVSTEVHPMMIFEEMLLSDDDDDNN